MAPKKILFEVEGYECLRCGKKWVPKIKSKSNELLEEIVPRICPQCKSPYWDRVSRNKKGGNKK